MVREVRVTRDHLMQPLFVGEQNRERIAIPGLTGVYRDTTDSILTQIDNDLEVGVKSFLLFGVPQKSNPINFDFTTQQLKPLRNDLVRTCFWRLTFAFALTQITGIAEF
jgi:porphobilinogen synthase